MKITALTHFGSPSLCLTTNDNIICKHLQFTSSFAWPHASPKPTEEYLAFINAHLKSSNDRQSNLSIFLNESAHRKMCIELVAYTGDTFKQNTGNIKRPVTRWRIALCIYRRSITIFLAHGCGAWCSGKNCMCTCKGKEHREEIQRAAVGCDNSKASSFLHTPELLPS